MHGALHVSKHSIVGVTCTMVHFTPIASAQGATLGSAWTLTAIIFQTPTTSQHPVPVIKQPPATSHAPKPPHLSPPITTLCLQGCGLCEYSNVRDAETALDTLDRSTLAGQHLPVLLDCMSGPAQAVLPTPGHVGRLALSCVV